MATMSVSMNKNTHFTQALAMQSRGRNSSPARDLVLSKLTFPSVLFSGGVFFSQMSCLRHLVEKSCSETSCSEKPCSEESCSVTSCSEKSGSENSCAKKDCSEKSYSEKLFSDVAGACFTLREQCLQPPFAVLPYRSQPGSPCFSQRVPISLVTRAHVHVKAILCYTILCYNYYAILYHTRRDSIV